VKITLKRFAIALSLIAVVATFTGKRISYTANCINCLEYIRGKEILISGLTVSHRHYPIEEPNRTVSSPLLPDIPSGSTEILLGIIGTPCEHDFNRSGFGRSPLLGGSVGCGSYSEGNISKPRRYALSALSHLYTRVPELEMARETYRLIGTLGPSDFEPLPDRLLREPKLNELSMLLNLINSAEEWVSTLEYLESPSSQINPLLKDPKNLVERVKSDDPIIRQTSATALINLETDHARETLEMLLDNPDPEVIAKASSSILANREMDLFGKMLRLQKRPINSFWLNRYTNDELRALFAYNDPAIDRFCFEAITESHRLNMLSAVLECLNRRNTLKAKEAIQLLIEGVNPLKQNGDAWEKLEPLSLPLDELRGYLEVGTASKQKDPRKWKFLNAVKAFESQASASDWDYLHTIYLREVTRGVNETYGAVMARALMHLDPKRTREFLLSELETEEHHRQTSALAGMGLIADQGFEAAILEFRSSIPSRNQFHAQPRDIFNNSHYRQYLDFAQHRCSGIHKWQLVQGSSGRYEIQN